MKIITELPFDWNIFEKDFKDFIIDYPETDYNDDESLEQIVDYFDNKYSKEELISVKDKIIKFKDSFIKEQIQDDLNYYLNGALSRLMYNNSYNITKEIISNYINEWFNTYEE